MSTPKTNQIHIISAAAIVAALVVLAVFIHKDGIEDRREKMELCSRILDNTVLRLRNGLQEVETATINTLAGIERDSSPNALLKYSREIVSLNPNIDGCSITMEPDYYGDDLYGFSAYSIQTGDKVTTVREGDYDYYSKAWYRTPKITLGPCWLDPYDDYNPGTLYTEQLIASYCVPILNPEGRFIGVISSDIELRRIGEIISSSELSDGAYCFMVGSDGYFLVHPDSAKLLKETIFSGRDRQKDADIFEAGSDMIKGIPGQREVRLDGKRCELIYRPVPGTSWSLGVVLPLSK